MAREKNFSVRIGFLLLFSFILTGCLGTPVNTPAPSSSISEAPIHAPIPAATHGNIVLVSNDEVPVQRNNRGEPIRQDNESQGVVLQFEGFNEN